MNDTRPLLEVETRAIITEVIAELTALRGTRQQSAKDEPTAMSRLVSELGADALQTAIDTIKTTTEKFDTDWDLLGLAVRAQQDRDAQDPRFGEEWP